VVCVSWLLLLPMASSVSSDEFEKEWEQYKIKFEKKYEDEAEEARKKQNYKDVVKRIEAHNELYEKGLSTFTMGINQFADLDPGEPACGCQHRSNNEEDNHHHKH